MSYIKFIKLIKIYYNQIILIFCSACKNPVIKGCKILNDFVRMKKELCRNLHITESIPVDDSICAEKKQLFIIVNRYKLPSYFIVNWRNFFNCTNNTVNITISTANCTISTDNCMISTVNFTISTVNCTISTVNSQSALLIGITCPSKKCMENILTNTNSILYYTRYNIRSNNINDIIQNNSIWNTTNNNFKNWTC